jgi:hypothetical protein
MGRQVVVETSVTEALGNAPINSIGVLVGQITSQKDYVCFTVPTPCVSEEDEGDEENEGEIKKNRKSSTLNDLEDWWIIEHAQQVLRVLPGGLEVVGLYVVTPSESLKGFYPRLKQLLDGQQVMSQSFTLSKDRSLEVLSAPHNSRFLLHCCSKTKKCTMKSVDTSDKRSSFAPAELKAQDHSSRWCELTGTLAVDFTVSCDSLSTAPVKMAPQLKEALAPLFRSIGASFLIANDAIVDRSSSVTSTASKQKKIKVDLFRTIPDRTFDSSVSQKSGCLALKGSCVFSAFVHGKSTWSDAERAVKMDILRSILARFQVLMQELSTREEDSKNLTQHVETLEQWGFPKRASIKTALSPFPLSDYCFAGEEEQESVRMIQELFSLQDTASVKVLYVEDIEEDRPAEEDKERRDPSVEEAKTSKGSFVGLRLLGVAGAVLAATAASAVLWFMELGTK